MRVLFTICGRAGSRGITGKNCSGFLGVPLVYYTLAEIELYRKRHPEADAVIALNTDSVRLRELVSGSGIGFVDVLRNEDLAGDRASKVDVIRATWVAVKGAIDGDFDCVVDLDITSPLRTVGDLERLLEKRVASEADTVFTVVPSRRNPYFNMVVDDGSGCLSRVIESDLLARQQAPAVYDMNASMYAYACDFLDSGKQIFEGTCEGVLMRDTAVLDLDGPNDLELMQVIARYLFDTRLEFREVFETATGLANFKLVAS